MSPKDKKFFTGFIIACVICIVLVKVVFLGGTSKTSAVESIISENSGLNNISVFSYENKDENKVCAFNYTDESGKEGLGLAILGNNNRGSYDVDSILYSTDESVIVNANAVVDDIPCAVVAVTDKSEANKVVVSAKDTTTGADVKLKIMMIIQICGCTAGIIIFERESLYKWQMIMENRLKSCRKR